MKYTAFALLLVLVASFDVNLQDRSVQPSSRGQEFALEPDDPSHPPRRLALVIGNWNYGDKNLPNAKNDAEDITKALKASQFAVTPLENIRSSDLDTAVDKFTSSLQRGDIAFFYYAGHGAQVEHHNYLLPVDFKGGSALEIMRSGYDVALLDEKLAERGTRARILILDACRSNPFAPAERGLASMELGPGTLVEFAASGGKTAAENPTGHNGLFTQYVLQELNVPGIGAEELAGRVRDDVYKASKGNQFPFIYPGLVGDITLVPPSNTPDSFESSHLTSSPDADVASWRARLKTRAYLAAGSGSDAVFHRVEPGGISPFASALVQTVREGCQAGKLDGDSLFSGVSDRAVRSGAPHPVAGAFGSHNPGGQFIFAPRRGKLYALLIAGSHYDNFASLETPIHDSEELARGLRDSCGAVTELLEDPTRLKIREALKESAARLYEPEDQLVIFFAGHGIFDPNENQSYLVAHDSEGIESSPSAYQTYISATQLAYSIDNIPARHIMLIMDASFSGIASETR
jgi:uncharacterized caspase-like protein